MIRLAEGRSLIADLVAELVAIGWSEEQARQTDVQQLVAATTAR